MALGRQLSFIVLNGLLVSVLSGGCGSSNSKSCAEGSERCACYANKTCNKGLECHSALCVAAPESDGGAGGEGGDETVTGKGGRRAQVDGGSDSGGASAEGGDASGGNQNEGGTTTSTGGTTTSTGGTTTSAGGTTTSAGGTPTSAGGTPTSAGGTPTSAGGTPTSAGGTTGSGKLGPNQIANGDFSQGTAFWHVNSSAGAAINTGSVTTEGVYCISAYSSYTQVIGWPLASAQALSLRAGYTYSLAFRLVATSSANVSVKVGYFDVPYSPIYQAVTASAVTTNWKEYLQTFTVSGTAGTVTPLVGLAFTIAGFSSGQVCLDDVVLAQVI